MPAIGWSQTNTVSTGDWNDASVWSTGTIPGGATTVNVNNPLILNTNLTITTGTYNFFQNVTDVSGGSAYSLTATTSGGTLDIKAGVTTFEGTMNLDNSNLFVRNGATLIVGATTVNNQSHVTIESGGTLIINGNLDNNNNGTGTFSIAGLVQVNGNYSAPVGSVSLSGSGDFFTTGTISTTGSSDVFGSTNDCGTGPCSGRNLCGFANAIGSTQTLCSSGTPTGLTGNAVASPTYTWESSTTSSTSGFGLASGTNNTQNYTPGSLTQTTWYRRKVLSGSCTGISPPIQISVLPAGGGWKGVTNDWNTSSNWCDNTVPTSSTDVTISTGVPNMPQITAASNARNLTINSGASVTINGSNSLAIFGNLVNNGAFTPNTSTVTLQGSIQQTVSGNPINFQNLTINNSSGATPHILFNTFVGVLNTLTMTNGNINLSGYNVTLGQSVASPGTLSYSSGRFYNGNLTRWFNTSAIAIGNVSGLFPVGSATDYRPLYVGSTAALTTGGTIRAGHTNVATATTVSFADGASTVVRRQDSFWNLATGNGMAVSGTPFNLRIEGTGFAGISNVNDLRLTRASSVVGTAGVNGNTVTNPQVNRTLLSLANLTNNFYLGSTDASGSPLPVTLTAFTGKFVDQGVALNWSTASQTNFDYFQVERSANGIDFTSLGKINGEAFSTVYKTYDFIDYEVKSGKFYYRLKNVDRDGTFEYSRILTLNRDLAPSISVYPNPVNSGSSLQIRMIAQESSEGRFALYDCVGRIVATSEFLGSENEISLAGGVPPGVYLLKVTAGLTQQTFKIIVR